MNTKTATMENQFVDGKLKTKAPFRNKKKFHYEGKRIIQNKFVFIVISFWVMFLFHSITSANEPSNQQIIEKMEMFQKINNTKFELVLQQIRQLRQDMDKRFEQVDKRFEFIQQIILALLALTVGTPFVVEMWKSRRS